MAVFLVRDTRHIIRLKSELFTFSSPQLRFSQIIWIAIVLQGTSHCHGHPVVIPWFACLSHNLHIVQARLNNHFSFCKVSPQPFFAGSWVWRKPFALSKGLNAPRSSNRWRTGELPTADHQGERVSRKASSSSNQTWQPPPPPSVLSPLWWYNPNNNRQWLNAPRRGLPPTLGGWVPSTPPLRTTQKPGPKVHPQMRGGWPQECAAAIARFDLHAVEWLAAVQRPHSRLDTSPLRVKVETSQKNNAIWGCVGTLLSLPRSTDALNPPSRVYLNRSERLNFVSNFAPRYG